jgi:cell division protein FtsZ
MVKKKSKKSLEKQPKPTSNRNGEVFPKGRKEEMHRPKILVIGVGGGGSNIVAEVAPLVPRIDFLAANTDVQALLRIGKTCRKFFFGQSVTHGLGCGGNARLGAAAAKSAEEKIAKLFQGVDFCVFISCLGGGTGSGAVSEFAAFAKKARCLTLGVFTLPFRFEGEKRMQVARQALTKTIPLLSASVIFPNEKIFQILDKGIGFQSALASVNAMLAKDLKNLMDVLYLPGLVNIDFADLKSVLEGEGRFAYLASAEARGENRAEIVSQALLSHPLNDYNPKGAERILFHIAADKNFAIQEMESISNAISSLNPQAKMIFGVSNRPGQEDNVTVTILATGSMERQGKGDNPEKRKAVPSRERERQRAKILKRKKTPLKEDIQVVVHQGAVRQTEHELPKANQLSAKVKKKIKSSPVPSQKKRERQHQGKISKNRIMKKTISIRNVHRNQEDSDRQQNKIRKNALDIRKEIELAAQKQQEEEKRWDVPAFLRRNVSW